MAIVRGKVAQVPRALAPPGAAVRTLRFKANAVYAYVKERATESAAFIELEDAVATFLSSILPDAPPPATVKAITRAVTHALRDFARRFVKLKEKTAR